MFGDVFEPTKARHSFFTCGWCWREIQRGERLHIRIQFTSARIRDYTTQQVCQNCYRGK